MNNWHIEGDLPKEQLVLEDNRYRGNIKCRLYWEMEEFDERFAAADVDFCSTLYQEPKESFFERIWIGIKILFLLQHSFPEFSMRLPEMSALKNLLKEVQYEGP
jgi:hypothetical protein